MYYGTILFIFLVYHKAPITLTFLRLKKYICTIAQFYLFSLFIIKLQWDVNTFLKLGIVISKDKLFQVNHTPIPSLRNFVNKKVGDQKN